MALVANYHVLFRGGANQTMRAQIQLSDAAGVTLAYLKFYDLGALTANDTLVGGVINMNLPWVAFDGVMDILRNEQPIDVYWAGLGFLSTSTEPVGEAE